jgi:phage gp45-like
MSTIDTALDVLLRNGRGAVEQSGKIFGVVPAIVVAIHDDKGPKRHKLGMMQVYFPWLQTEDDPKRILPWARQVFQNAGGGDGDANKGTAGFYSTPQIGDEVLVAFDQGDPHHPYVLGSMWNGMNRIPLPVTDKDNVECAGHHPGGPTHKTPDLTPKALGGDAGANKTYFWRSRTGNLVILDDDQGTVRILDRSGNSVVQLEKGDVRVLQKDGKGIFMFAEKTVKFDCTNFEIHAKNDIFMHCDKDWSVKADKNVTMDIGGSFHSKVGTGLHFQAKKDVNLTATKGVAFKSNLAMNVKASAKQVKMESGAMYDVFALMDATGGSKQKVNFKAANINVMSLMAINVQASGKVNAKAGVIMMN